MSVTNWFITNCLVSLLALLFSFPFMKTCEYLLSSSLQSSSIQYQINCYKEDFYELDMSSTQHQCLHVIIFFKLMSKLGLDYELGLLTHTRFFVLCMG